MPYRTERKVTRAAASVPYYTLEFLLQSLDATGDVLHLNENITTHFQLFECQRLAGWPFHQPIVNSRRYRKLEGGSFSLSFLIWWISFKKVKKNIYVDGLS